MRKKPLNFLFIFLFILNSCSFDNKTGIWKEHNKQIIKEVRSQEKIEKIFKKKEIFEDEIESKDLVILSKELKNISWPEDNLFENNDQHVTNPNQLDHWMRFELLVNDDLNVDYVYNALNALSFIDQ